MKDPREIYRYFVDVVVLSKDLSDESSAGISTVISDFGNSYFDKKISIIGTAAHERFNTRKEAIGFFQKQRNEIRNLTVETESSNFKEKKLAGGSIFLFEEDIDIRIKEIDQPVIFRLSIILEKKYDQWVIVQGHASSPDKEIDEEEHLPIIGLQKKNEELEATIKERTRELVVEASLERVRVAAMAMQSSNELTNVVNVLREEMGQLGQLGIQASAINRYHENGETFDLWYAYRPAGQTNDAILTGMVTLPAKTTTLAKQMVKHFHSDADEYLMHPRGKSLQEWYDLLIEKVPEIAEKLDKERPESIYWYFTDFSGGSFAMTSLDKPTIESKKLQQRVTGVFDLAYRRFLDLQKAEAQALEAQIEAALERLRAKSTSMHKSDELADVMLLLNQELTSLGVDHSTTMFTQWDWNTYQNGSDIWMAAAGESYLQKFKFPFSNHPISTQYLQARKNDVRFYTEAYTKKEKNEYLRISIKEGDLGQIPKERLQYIFDAPGLSRTVENFENSSLMVQRWNTEEFSKDQLDIIRRAGMVFKQSYTRFLDLKKAEAQAREAQIEAALERVRAKSLAMQRSSELKSVIDTIYTELIALNTKVHTLQIGTNLSKDGFDLWISSNDNQTYEESIWIPRFDHPLLTKPIQAMESGTGFYQETLDKETKDKGFKLLFEHTELAFISAKRKRQVMEAPGVHRSFIFQQKVSAFLSMLNYANEEFSDFENEVFKKFGIAFEQAYTRFLDLKKVEAQAREAQIETSLERVRAATMAMHNSNEVGASVVKMFNELMSLGVEESTRCGIGILNHENTQMELWTAAVNPDEEVQIHIGKLNMNLHPLLIQARTAWVDGKDMNFYHLQGSDLKEYYKMINQAELYPHKFDLRKLPPSTYHYDFTFSHGILYAFTRNPLSDELTQVFNRFASLFSQTYRRYQDLVRAENQAREAEIQLALERVRAKTMAMHSSEEMAETAHVLFEQLVQIGIIHERINIGIVNEAREVIEFWVTEQGGKQINKKFEGSIKEPIILAKMYKAWKNNELSQVLEISGKKLEKWLTYLQEEIGIPFDPKLKQDKRTQTSGFFSQGMIVVTNPTPLPEDQVKILERFASVFEQTYTRFLDLQKAEAQARKAQVEAALERIRTQATGMQQSSDLFDIVVAMRQEFIRLGHEADYFWHMRWMPEQYEMSMTTESGNRLGTVITVPKYVHEEIEPLNKWEASQEPSFVLALNAENGWHYIDKMNKHGQYDLADPDAPSEEDIHAMGGLTFVIARTTHGEIGFSLPGEVSNPPIESIQTIERFAKVFDLAYKRFVDLEKAEAQAREAQIEAALERIRAQATGMLKSTDLLDIVVTMRKEFVELGHEAHYFWHMKWCPDKYEKAMTSGDGSKIGMVMELPRHIHGDVPLLAEWELGTEPTVVYAMNVDEAIAYVNKMILLGDFERVDPKSPTTDDIRKINGLTYVMARTSHGEIGYSLPGEVPNPPEEDVNTLRRFASVFDLAYRRFEDLRKAEIRAREAQVEAAVERVRAEAMAMHQPSDLVKVTQVMIGEISNLGIEGITGAAFILVDEKDIVTMWDISDPGNMGFTRDYKSVYDPSEFRMLGEFWRKWKRGMEYFVIKYDLEKNKKVLEEWSVVDAENYKNLKRAIEQNKLKTQWNPFGSFSRGLLTLDMMNEPDRDTKNIVIKMAKTFDLAYQRFDDLQKAEQQAKAAKKQASLDRIRAEIASMRNQKDLEHITPLIWSELVALEVPFFRCGVFIIDADAQKVQVYLSTPGGESIAAISFDFNDNEIVDDSVEYWRKQAIYRTRWTREEFVTWSKNLLEQGLIPNVKSYQHEETPPDNLHLQFVPFKQGMLYVGSDHYLGTEHMKLIKDIADDFSIAYSRYEDFVRLEKAKYQTETAYGELKSTQSQLIHAEKMASLGELTAGIAHEIQNPLNFVNNFSDLNSELVDELKEALEAGDTEEVMDILSDIKENEQKIIHHGRRAEEIVKSMLQHSRGGDGKKELTNINLIADEYLRLSYHGLRAKDKSFNADFRCNLDEEIPKISVVPQDIGRVLLNLINNAFHAVREKSQTVDNGYLPAVEVITKKVGDTAEIIVRDNGSGIPDEIKEKIFQPFFTTKATGSGTGLGLSLSFDIITKGHNGTIEVKSKKGEGSEFIINLPIE